MNFNALNDFVILKKLTLDKTEGGLLLPDIAQEGTYLCEVITVGPGRQSDNGFIYPMHTKGGDKVIIPKFAGKIFEYKDEEFIAIREVDILVILK